MTQSGLQQDKSPIASFLIPVYNAEAYLPEAIESALKQTETNIEVVAIDDGSTDSSHEILRRYAVQDPRVRVFEEEHRGLVPTRNRGLGVARGKYICILDADDVAMPDRIEKQAKFLEEHPDHVLVGGQVTFIGRGGETMGASEYPSTSEAFETELKTSCCFTHSSVMFRRVEALSAGGYDPLFAPSEDYDLLVRLAANYRLGNLSDIVCLRRSHENQVSLSAVLLQSFATMCTRAAFRGVSREKIRESVQAEGKEFFQTLRQLGYSNDEIAEEIAGTYLRYAASMRRMGRHEMAFRLLSEAKGHLKDLKCNPRYLAPVYSWEFIVSVGARNFPRAARSLFLAFAHAPRKTAQNILSRLFAPQAIVRNRIQVEP